MTELKPCPFCGEVPELPDGRGSQYEIWCDCGQAMSCIQISDLMTIEERMPEKLAPPEYKYSQVYVDRARDEAIEAWNKRHKEQ